MHGIKLYKLYVVCSILAFQFLVDVRTEEEEGQWFQSSMYKSPSSSKDDSGELNAWLRGDDTSYGGNNEPSAESQQSYNNAGQPVLSQNTNYHQNTYGTGQYQQQQIIGQQYYQQQPQQPFQENQMESQQLQQQLHQQYHQQQPQQNQAQQQYHQQPPQQDRPQQQYHHHQQQPQPQQDLQHQQFQRQQSHGQNNPEQISIHQFHPSNNQQQQANYPQEQQHQLQRQSHDQNQYPAQPPQRQQQYNQNQHQPQQIQGSHPSSIDHRNAASAQQQQNFERQSSQSLQNVHQQQQHQPPPQREIIQEETWKKKGDTNPWLFEQPKDQVTWSPQDEKFRQEVFSKTKTKWDFEDEEAQKLAKLPNRGGILIEKTHLTKDELLNGGNRIQNHAVVQVGGGGQQYFNPQQQLTNYQPHGDPNFQTPPPEFYKGKVQEDPNVKRLLAQAYEIKNRRPPPPHPPHSPPPPPPIHPQQPGHYEDQAPLASPPLPRPIGRQSHRMDDPPTQIIYKDRWFDDDIDVYGNSGAYLKSGWLILIIVMLIIF